MATIKAYSVAQTEKKYGGTPVQSSVYSLSPGTAGAERGGRNGAYDHASPEGLVEGRVKTLLNGSRAVVNHDVNSIKSVKTSATNAAVKSTTVVATTTSLDNEGAGLIVKFTTTAAGAINATAGNYTIVDGGEGYATDDEVEIDGFPGSVLVVTAA